MGDTIDISCPDTSLTTTASNGYSLTENFNASTGAITDDSWTDANGRTGIDTYGTDGSSTGT